ncbi:MAG: MMPL family transporter [Propionibacteriaceae bacterium]|jgi:RND superfamily putative drug exporter|nr:MMPL family transporter [Propionibacteriaceae bacterium]
MSSLLYALGLAVARFKGRVIAAWAVFLAVLAALAMTFSTGLDANITIPGLEAVESLTSLSHTFPQTAGSSAQIIVVAADGDKVDDAAYREPIERLVERLPGLPNVTRVVSPFDDLAKGAISDDRRAALIQVQVCETPGDPASQAKAALQRAAAQLRADLPPSAQSSLGGALFAFVFPEIGLTEAFGVVVALIVLIMTFGSILAAGLPILVALAVAAGASSSIYFATFFTSINTTTPILGLMLGLAVGIDYSLFIVSRHRQQLASGLPVAQSVGQALATAGSAVVFAGLTVIVALLGLAVARIPFLTVMGIGAAGAVTLAVAAAITLLPAVMALCGDKLRPRAARAGAPAPEAQTAAPPVAVPALPVAAAVEPAADKPDRKTRFYRGWVRFSTRRPVVTIFIVVAILLLPGLRAFDLKLSLPDSGWLEPDDPARITYDLVSEHFGAGFNATLILTGSVLGSNDPVGLMNRLGQEVAGLEGVRLVPLATPNPSADTGIVQIIPAAGLDSPETHDLVRRLRGMHQHFLQTYGIDTSVTGMTAVMIDVSERLSQAMLPFGLVVVGLSFGLLMLVFRSLAVPIKATVGYLLSVVTAVGVVVIVFQDGVGANLFNLPRVGPVLAFMPIIVMGVLFGLAMDYEVFLVSRIREAKVHGASSSAAIEEGFVSSSRVVTAAAIIMIAVFVAFVPDSELTIKPMALGLAVGVAADAFLVRLTLVPAVLSLLGDRAWRLPARLERALPQVDVEGHGLTRELELKDWPEPDTKAVVAAQEVSLPTGQAGHLVQWSARLEPGQVHLVLSSDPVAARSALWAASGRLPATDGRLKTLGWLLPAHAVQVRRHSGLIDLSTATDPVRALRRALDEAPQLLAIDGLDRIEDLGQRTALRELLSRRDHNLSLLLAGGDPAAIVDLIGFDQVSHIESPVAREEILL